MATEHIGGSSAAERQLWADANAWLHMQALQWEPAGHQLLAELGQGTGLRAVDMGCGALGWLRLLSRWVGPGGEVLGTEVSEATAGPARLTVKSEGLSNVTVVVDDVFDSWLPARSYDLVHARFMLGPLGRQEQQLETYRRLVRPGGWLVLEEPDMCSWRFNPDAPANQRLMDLSIDLLGEAGRDFSSGRQVRAALRALTDKPALRAHILALPPGHAYRALSLMSATTLRSSLAERVGAGEIDELIVRAEEELRDPERWCTSFTLIQGYARVP